MPTPAQDIAGSAPARPSPPHEESVFSDEDLFKEIVEEQVQPLASFDGTGWEGCDNDAITVSYTGWATITRNYPGG